jgi:hypothetical protein
MVILFDSADVFGFVFWPGMAMVMGIVAEK